MNFKWNRTEKKKPNRSDYVLICNDDERVRLAIYHHEEDIFVDLIDSCEVEPIWWGYIPPTPSELRNWKWIGNWEY